MRLTQDALRQNPGTDERRRLLRNLAEVAILAGRLAADDLGNAMSGRAYYSLALDTAREAADDQLTAIAYGHAAQLAVNEGLSTAALGYLTEANEHARSTPAIASWLASTEATIHADRGDHTPTRDALDRAQTALDQPTGRRAPASFCHCCSTHLTAATGHVLLQSGDHNGACKTLIGLLDHVRPIPRRQRVLVLIDLATAELRSGDLPAACSRITQVADLLHRDAYALGVAHLRAFRAEAQGPLNSRALRVFDEHLTRIAA